jgi:hypothetical protein
MNINRKEGFIRPKHVKHCGVDRCYKPLIDDYGWCSNHLLNLYPEFIKPADYKKFHIRKPRSQ